MHQYLRPDSPPNAMKKSPLAMLVETCSNIGQELTASKPVSPAQRHTTRSSPGSQRRSNSPQRTQFHSRYPSTTKSVSPQASSPDARSIAAAAGRMPQASVMHGAQNIAANLAAQYQLIYQQQLMFQTELEFLKMKERFASAQNSLLDGNKKMCAMCCLKPGYNGQCVHTELLDMNSATMSQWNPVAALQLSKMASVGLPLDSLPIPTAQKTSPSQHLKQMANLMRRHSTSPPTMPLKVKEEQSTPINLKVASERKPQSEPAKLCHWVGTSGYCGKQFKSQEELMNHLRSHVLPTSDPEPKHKPQQAMPPKDRMKSMRFNPYGRERTTLIKH